MNFGKTMRGILGLLAIAGLAACSSMGHKTTDTTTSTQESRNTAAAANPSPMDQDGGVQRSAYDRSVTLNFEPGSSDLTPADQTKLQNLVTSIGSDNIDRIEVAAWSDKNLPQTRTDLARTDRNLAADRAKRINDYISDNLSVSTWKIKTFNMAEGSNWLARMFRTDDAELKSSFSKESGAPMAREDFNVIAREGSPSKAVVVLVRK